MLGLKDFMLYSKNDDTTARSGIMTLKILLREMLIRDLVRLHEERIGLYYSQLLYSEFGCYVRPRPHVTMKFTCFVFAMLARAVR